MYGYAGQMMRINLKTGSVTKAPLPEEFTRKWIGARGMVAKILYDEVPRDADPLGPENLFIVATGLLTGIFMAAGSKCSERSLQRQTATPIPAWAVILVPSSSSPDTI